MAEDPGKPKTEGLREEVVEGYRRLALGSSNDALKLLFLEEPSWAELEGLDLFNVSDIKRPKTGGMEIRFYDRCQALLRLEALCGAAEGQDCAQAFYAALANAGGRRQETGIENIT